jgi:hypothetical protein
LFRPRAPSVRVSAHARTAPARPRSVPSVYQFIAPKDNAHVAGIRRDFSLDEDLEPEIFHTIRILTHSPPPLL